MRKVTRLTKAASKHLVQLSAEMKRYFIAAGILLACLSIAIFYKSNNAEAQAAGPTMLVPDLAVRTVVAGLASPTTLAFLGDNDTLVLEKNTGKVQRIVDGAIQSTVLDLAVNFASERGLLGIALHPAFGGNNYVYLYWTWRGSGEGDEMLLGPDSSNLAEVPLVGGNRVDRFVWDGSTLTFDRNIIKLRTFQADPGQPLRGNHNGGVIRFRFDGKLFIVVGDAGRRGQMQNLPSGPTLTGLGDPVRDDQFGGPEPDDAHLTGVILRLNDDGSAPEDNPFYEYGAQVGGEVGANIQKIFVHGIRNSFGVTFDPVTSNLWTQENSDDAFDEINRWEAGMNGGWVQIMGPTERIQEFKSIELTLPPSGGLAGAQLQQARWPADRIADTPEEALSRLFAPPGSRYSEPEFSWKYAVSPGGIGFLRGPGLGPAYEDALFVGAATPALAGGYIMVFRLTEDRQQIAVNAPGLEDRVADNTAKYDATESESLIIGRDFGVVTDVYTAPNGNLYIVSLSRGAIYEIYRPEPATESFTAALSGSQEVPALDTPAGGQASFELNAAETELKFKLSVANITNVVAGHIHIGQAGANGPVVAFLYGDVPPAGGPIEGTIAEGTITKDNLVGPLRGMEFSELVKALREGGVYANVHTNDGVAPTNTGPGDFPGGEVRGQVAPGE